MSHNIVIAGYGMFPWQTPTTVTRDVLARARGTNALEADLHAPELLRAWVHSWADPKPLSEKDARNPYLAERRAAEIEDTDAIIDGIKDPVVARGGGSRVVGSN